MLFDGSLTNTTKTLKTLSIRNCLPVFVVIVRNVVLINLLCPAHQTNWINPVSPNLINHLYKWILWFLFGQSTSHWESHHEYQSSTSSLHSLNDQWKSSYMITRFLYGCYKTVHYTRNDLEGYRIFVSNVLFSPGPVIRMFVLVLPQLVEVLPCHERYRYTGCSHVASCSSTQPWLGLKETRNGCSSPRYAVCQSLR